MSFCEKGNTHFPLKPFTYSTYDLPLKRRRGIFRTTAMNVARSSKLLAPPPQIMLHRISQDCGLGKLTIYKNLKWCLQEVNASLRHVCPSIRPKVLCLEFDVGCMQWENTGFASHSRAYTPSPSLLGKICSYKIRGSQSGVAEE